MLAGVGNRSWVVVVGEGGEVVGESRGRFEESDGRGDWRGNALALACADVKVKSLTPLLHVVPLLVGKLDEGAELRTK